MTTLEKKEVRGLRWREVVIYLSTVIGISFAMGTMYNSAVNIIRSNQERIESNSQKIDVLTKNAQLRTDKENEENRNFELRITILETKENMKR